MPPIKIRKFNCLGKSIPIGAARSRIRKWSRQRREKPSACTPRVWKEQFVPVRERRSHGIGVVDNRQNTRKTDHPFRRKADG
jgi:hypothetical protein